MRPIVLLILLATSYRIAYAQADDEPTDDPRGNTNMGLTLSGPINPTARMVDLGFGATLGAGYNFTRRHAVVGEFMWNHLYANSEALNQIRAALHNPSIDASGNLIAFTGNYRFELRGQEVGTYLIAGGGWYHRSAGLSQSVTTGKSITCTPVWLWYGFSCQSGVVVADQTIKSTSSNALGVNGGIGFTARVGDAPDRVYVEARYHFAPHRGVSTQIVSVTVGIRY
jgi:hypothetical protein